MVGGEPSLIPGGDMPGEVSLKMRQRKGERWLECVRLVAGQEATLMDNDAGNLNVLKMWTEHLLKFAAGVFEHMKGVGRGVSFGTGRMGQTVGRGEKAGASWPHHPADLGKKAVLRWHMLNDFDGANEVEGASGKGQMERIANGQYGLERGVAMGRIGYGLKGSVYPPDGTRVLLCQHPGAVSCAAPDIQHPFASAMTGNGSVDSLMQRQEAMLEQVVLGVGQNPFAGEIQFCQRFVLLLGNAAGVLVQRGLETGHIFRLDDRLKERFQGLRIVQICQFAFYLAID